MKANYFIVKNKFIDHWFFYSVIKETKGYEDRIAMFTTLKLAKLFIKSIRETK